MPMNQIPSVEQRSSSELILDAGTKQDRIILANRLEPEVKWCTSGQAPQSNRCHLFKRLSESFHSPFRHSAGSPVIRVRGSSVNLGPRYDEGPFPSNEWRTSKYSLLNFLPKNLFEQFRRLANFYFLAMACMQLMLPYSPVGPATSLLPLLFVVCTSAIKQGYEDILRHKMDKEINNRLFRVMKRKKLVKTRSKDIRVGDIVLVRNNEEIPCDMILLAVSGQSDKCYITTANLDGETSLKGRSCLQIKQQLGPISKLDQNLLVVECERPNATIYEFNGFMRTPKSAQVYNDLINDIKSHQINPDGIHETVGQIVMRRLKQSGAVFHLGPNTSSDLVQSNKAEAKKDEIAFEVPLDINNLLLRASRLRNTAYIYGLVVYTGNDTKLAHNSQVKPNKFSSLENRVNLFLIIAFILLLILSLSGTLLSIKYRGLKDSGLNSEVDSFFAIFMSYFLLFNYLVPISLYVTLEFVKFLGTIAVIKDKKMRVDIWRTVEDGVQPNKANLVESSHDPSSMSIHGSKKFKMSEGPRCNSSDLNEELGQVEVLFSDKTGTLTENKMRFMACSVYGQLFRQINDRLYKQSADLFKAPIPNVVGKLSRIASGRHASLSPQYPHSSSVSSETGSITPQKKLEDHNDLSESKPFDHQIIPSPEKLESINDIGQRDKLLEFLLCICLCSNVNLNETLPLADCLPDKTMNEYDFQSASPDEESLISTAHNQGVTMCKSNDQECFLVIRRTQTKPKSPNFMTSGKFAAMVEGKNSNEKYIIRHFKRLLMLEFSSARKRMSVIYKDCDNDCIIIVSKGSEELLDCVKLNNLDAGAESCINSTLAHFEAFAMSGLRTLLVAFREISKQDYKKIEAELRDARASINSRDILMSKLYRKVESDFRLIGATAVEDTLQEKVPETIAQLREAGIKVWLLTGDKVETAISVAYLCKLLDRDMTLFHLVRQQSLETCRRLLSFFRNRQLGVNQIRVSSALSVSNTKNRSPEKPKSAESKSSVDSNLRGEEFRVTERFALIADGRSLHYAMRYAREELAQLCEDCSCVLGCRLSPLQKAEVVDMIKNGRTKPITAAIGDGANDVSMIQEAHVGIGISGKEGRQAVNCSDFAIHRFYMLSRLLFVHGHYFYHRTSNTILYFFYKNLLFVVPQFLFSLYNLNTVTSFYPPILLVSFNLFFTSVPVLLYGLHERHIPEAVLERYPKLYQLNYRNKQMNLSVFFSFLTLAVVQASVGFYVLYFIWQTTPFIEANFKRLNGFSITLYFVIVITATLDLYYISRWHTLLFTITSLGSCLIMPLFLYTYSLFDWSFLWREKSLQGQLSAVLNTGTFWLAIGLTTLAMMIPNIGRFVAHQVIFFKDLYSKIRHSKQNTLHSNMI